MHAEEWHSQCVCTRLDLGEVARPAGVGLGLLETLKQIFLSRLVSDHKLPAHDILPYIPSLTMYAYVCELRSERDSDQASDTDSATSLLSRQPHLSSQSIAYIRE